MLRRKLVIVGDGFCGKTALLLRFKEDLFLLDVSYTPTIFENDLVVVSVDGKQIELSLWDTAGQEDYEQLRPLSYGDVDIILICFSVDLPESLANCQEKWVPEVREFCPDVPYILVATKLDLRYDDRVMERLRRRQSQPISDEEGSNMADFVRAKDYFETSAKNGEGVAELFQSAARIAVRGKKFCHCSSNCCSIV